MVAAAGLCPAPPEDVPPGDPTPVLLRRVIAVAVTPHDLLRPGSDLARAAGRALPVDLLACADGPDAAPSDGGPGDRADDPDDAADDGVGDAVRAAVRRLDLPGLVLHRLALPTPLTGAAEEDLVAALSELVGFDPESGVQLLAPVPLPGDAERAVVDRATRRVAAIYRLPLHHYR